MRIMQNSNIRYSHSVNSLKDDGGSSATCSERLQTRGGLAQIHGCDQNTKEHLEGRGRYVSKTACLHRTLSQETSSQKDKTRSLDPASKKKKKG